MGMFDTVYAHCECGELVEFQSKAGDCNLASYGSGEVPTEIAKDLEGTYETCKSCNTDVFLWIKPLSTRAVPMYEDYR